VNAIEPKQELPPKRMSVLEESSGGGTADKMNELPFVILEDLKKTHIKLVKNSIETKTLVWTSITGSNVEIKVTDAEMREGGIFSSNYMAFNVITQANHTWSVSRKESDFFFLRKVLQKQFPHILIPTLPKKMAKNNVKSMKKREKEFTIFMQAVCRSEVLKCCDFLVEFLSVFDQKEYNMKAKAVEKQKFSRNIQDLITEAGYADVKQGYQKEEYSKMLNDYMDTYQTVYTEIINLSQ